MPTATLSKMVRNFDSLLLEHLLFLLLFGNVEEKSLHKTWAARLIPHHNCLIANPNNMSISGEQAIFRREGFPGVSALENFCEHPLSIVRMKLLEDKTGIPQPFVCREAQHRFNLGADVKSIPGFI
jgi:hypothetical protein